MRIWYASALFVGLLLCRPVCVVSQEVTLPVGTLTLPRGFTHQALRGTDSYPGVIRRAGGGLEITYDIGPMAGARVHPSRRGEFVWFIEHDVGGHRAYSGVFLEGGRRRIATTVVGDGGADPLALPANFEAELRGGPAGDRDVAEFMLIVASYRPRAR